VSWPPRRLPAEAPAAALVGFKLGQLLLAVDGTAVAFAGLSIGAHRVYGPVAEADCVFSHRHKPPHKWCDCGFYCVHTMDAARAMTADTTYRGGVLLEVTASGRYIRYEKGLRYQRQRVRAVRVGLCGCGRRAETLIDSGEGRVGWRRMLAVCDLCAGTRPRVSAERIAELLPGVPVTPDHDARPIEDPGLAVPMWTGAESGEAKVAVLAAEIALLQARLDSVQARLCSLDGQDRPTSQGM
jgi:hypothetical protein